MKIFILSTILLAFSVAASAQCTALFTWDDTDITIQFMDASTTLPSDPIVSWSWDFDDNGNTSTLQNPTYTFSSPDKYDVTLTITTQSGCSSSITIEIETCVLAVNYSIGTCDANGNIPVMLTISDIYDNAKDIDVILDGSSVPGSPFEIDIDNPVSLNVSVPGNGLSHTIQIQSTDIATCGKTIDFTVPDCNSNCFLSSLQVGYPVGITHTVDVGDDFFSPVSTGIVLGDIVNFNWIGDGHSTTSDATTGADSWNSGVISVGSSFNVSIQNPGTHPYYCTPHGGTGGAGMSGEILANCPTGNNLDLDISFNASEANAQGFNVYYDANLVAGSPFSYAGVGPQQLTISITGDGNPHPLLIEDVNDPTCTLSMTYDAPDCGQGGGNPVCSISINLGAPGGCDASQNVSVTANVSIANGGSGFNLVVDNGASTFYPYNGPNTSVTLTLPGDGQSHTIVVTDDVDPACTASTTIVTPDCNLPCSIANLVATAGGGGGGAGILHTVNVEDFVFNPSIVNITIGDQVEWVWTGNVAHTATSDATSGPDSFDSGLLNNGATYVSPVLSEGEHMYYCTPHGTPGGNGMAGTIFVLPPCNAQGEVMVNVSFDITSNGTNGYEVLVDGTQVGVFPYVGGVAQSANVNVAGDGMSHVIEVRDVDDSTCTATTNIVTADCNGGGNPVCMIDVAATVAGGCDANNAVPVDLTVTASDQGSNFSVLVDGTSQGIFAYTGSITTISINVSGDGQSHTIVVTDDVDSACTASTSITTPDCNLPCSITNLVATASGGGGGGGILHTVNVEDFVFNPSIVNITVGDQVEWVWTGNVAHTATSDATSGPDSFDSGLLNNGATYVSPVLSEGSHMYYCTPHGSAGGNGMAGTIFVLPPCNAEGEVMVNISFDVTSNGTSGYEVLVDGSQAGVFPYVGGAAQSANINVPGDGMSHVIEVRDVDGPTCAASTNIVTADCNGGGNPVCMIDVAAAVSGGCDASNTVPVDVTVTASDQGSNFSVLVDGTSQGTYAYTGSTTTININIPGDGQSHTIVVTDDVDPACTASTTIVTPDCNLPCSIANLVATANGGGGAGVLHTVNVEDFVFNPSIVNITTGDQVEWVWTGNVAHTATSDATSGPDSFDSGLLNNGATYLSPVLSEGEHMYYCTPHGTPGGNGMAGTIFVLPPCNAQGEVMVNVSFDITSNGTNGYEVLVDGTQVGVFPYVGGVAQSANVNVAGDGMSHVIEVRDVDDSTCTATTSILTADCNGGGNPVCMIDVAAAVSGGCDASNTVPVDVTVTAFDQGSNFSVLVDGTGQGTYAYTGSTTTININIPGDGQSHTIVVTDDLDPACTASTTIVTPDCLSGCSISGISVSFGENTTHIIQVEDFVFSPDSIEILIGDTIIFDWVGNIPHTATSDATIGPNSFDSGLLGQGSVFEFIPAATGELPYYCKPHGTAGGVGMAGNIEVLAACSGSDAVLNISVESEGSSGQGFVVELDGGVVPESPLSFDPTGSTNGTILVPGDGMNHLIVVSDAANSSCIDSVSFVSPVCSEDVCETSIVNVDFGVCEGANVALEINYSSTQVEELFNIYFDGTLVITAPVSTDDSGQGNFNTIISGTGSPLEIVVISILNPNCSDTIIVATPDCSVPCLMSDASVAGGPTVHEVEVRDFDFFPADVQVFVGDTVRFVWTGIVPHTTTSDATSGVDTWDSGLFGEGYVYDVVIQEQGEHLYYCTPHGGPGGLGMAGSIIASEQCDNGQWQTNYSFSVSAGSPLGYNIFVDGEKWNSTPIAYQDPTGFNTGILSLPGDGVMHFVTFQDEQTDFCAITTTIISEVCEVPCAIEAFEAKIGADVINEIEVRDFDFFPLESTVRVGETVRFKWTGEVPHTSTSDALTGPDIWNSGLLSKGDSFDIVLTSIGEHPYYCEPHGGPGGIGQAGTIYALPSCQDGEQAVNISFIANGGSNNGFNLFVDGSPFAVGLPYDNTNGFNNYYIQLPADGQQHTITIQDADKLICAASTTYTSVDCSTDCEAAGLGYNLIKKKYVIEVRDFDYLPLDLTIEAGDTILFDWVGDVPHTVTSDAVNGPSVFNSGLLGKGDQWLLVLDEIGEHPYYCVPHGGPNGIGMAASITVVDPCDDDEVLAGFSFTSSRLSGAYDILLNGTEVLADVAYSGNPSNHFNLDLPADNSSLSIQVIDNLDSECSTMLDIAGINCSDPCFSTSAKYTYDIDFSTLEVQFSNTSTGNITSWMWDFGDGNTSDEANPLHTFMEPLVYEVCLTIVDEQGCEDTFCDKVRFSDEVCIAGFDFIQNDLVFTFVNTSDYEDPETEVLWAFGDGASSSEIDTAFHTFALGIYTVCIEISSDSCSASYCQELDLSDPCLLVSPDFEAENDGISMLVEFTDATSGNPDSWLWGFGDGTTSTEQNPTHTYSSFGEYSICLFVQESANNCSKSICRKVVVGTTGVQEVELYKTVMVYPNPSSQTSSVIVSGFSSVDIGKNAQLTVLSAQGQKLSEMDRIMETELQVEVSFVPGIYIVNINTDSNHYRALMVVQ